MKITTRGSIKFSEGNEDPTSSDLPNIYNFEVAFDAVNINRYVLYFSVDNCASLVLEKSLIDEKGAVVGKIDGSQIVVGTLSKVFNKDKIYKTKFKLIATNKNGSTSAELEPIDVGTGDLNVFATNLITSFSAERSANSYDEVDVKITIAKIDDFNIQDLDQLELRYKRQDFSNYLSVILDNKINKLENLDASGNVLSYSYEFKKVKIIRQSIGGFFNFLCRVTVKNFQSQDTDSLIIYFPDLSVSQTSLVKDSSFPEAQILNPEAPASLRYEFLVKFSEAFTHQKNAVYKENEETTKADAAFGHRFLDPDKVTGLDYDDLLIMDESDQYLFSYEFNNSKQSGTKGYIYPASVSDILPCIKVSNDGNSILLFWKINDNFFDYSMMKGSVSITTTELKAKLQFKDPNDGLYYDIKGEFTIERKHFQNSTQKFIIEIKNTDSPRKDLFALIKDSDNATDNLKIVITSHTVLCSTKLVSSKVLTFNKLLIPNQWKYIAYDKYISKAPNVTNSTDKTVSLDLDDLSLRGIRLPEKGFKKFDTILGIRNLVKTSVQTYVFEYDLSIFYKLSCSFDSFYQDPIREGTINAIVLPKIPDDTFLVAPKVVIPPPNFKTIGNGGIQAEAVVNLNEYGKISAIQLTEIGEGYSYFKTALSKRQQMFSDFTPAVKSSYTVVASDTGLHNDFLYLKNLSFDLGKLKASLSGGVRLASVLADKEKIDSSSDGGNPLSQLQKTQINQYLEDYLPEDAEVEGNSVAPYEVKSQAINYNAQDILDETWFELSKLYTEKYTNPLFETNIYSEDDDAATATIDQDAPSSNIVESTESASLTPSSIVPSSQQTSADGGAWSLFELNNLLVVPDGSPALNVSNINKSPPWLTLMPLSVRSDGMWAFGPLPNMAPRAEMFNRIVTAINSLNEVRIIAPFIWLVTQNNTMNIWLKPVDPSASQFDIVTFSQDGTKIMSSNTTVDFALPINSALSVGASRSVQKEQKKTFEVAEYGLGAGIYISSSEQGSSITFKPTVHPFMSNALPRFVSANIRRKYLGLVSEGIYSCSSVVPPRAPGTNTTVMYCASSGPNGGSYPKPIPPVQLPISKFKPDTYFEFFNTGGSLSASPYGTARFFGVPNGVTNGYQRFCSYECGDSYGKTVDFSYTNMYPATYKL
jgi:hypothetical protein